TQTEHKTQSNADRVHTSQLYAPLDMMRCSTSCGRGDTTPAAQRSLDSTPGVMVASVHYTFPSVIKEEAMRRSWTSLSVLRGGLVLGIVWLLGGASAQQPAPQYPLDDKLANEPAPWTVPGKWGKRGNWGRWGEEDKRGMLNYITPKMVVKAVGLVKQGKVYALGEELHNDVPRIITPTRIGIQIMQERDGYDRPAGKSGEFDPKRAQGAASFTFMHNHTGSHLDTFSHVYRENSIYNNAPPPRSDGTV